MRLTREKLVVIVFMLVVGGMIAWQLLVPPVAPAAIVVSGDQILKEVQVDGDTVTSGVWVVDTMLNFPTGSIVFLKEMTSGINGGEAQTQREIKLEFTTHSPYYRARLQEKFFGIETKNLQSVGTALLYLHKQYQFQYYTVPDSWVDSWAAFDVKMYVDGALVDSKAQVLIGPDPTWGTSTGTVEGETYYSRATLQYLDSDTQEQETLTIYALGWLNRGLTEPSKDVAIIWDPYDLRFEYLDKSQLESRLEANKQFWGAGWETYGQLYDSLGIGNLPRLDVGDVYEASLVTPSGYITWPDPSITVETVLEPLQTSLKPSWDLGWFGWGGPISADETNVWILGKAGVEYSMNIDALIMADATLFDTIIWRPAAGVPEIVTLVDPVVFTSGGKGIQEVVVKNVGTTIDSFVGTLALTNPHLTGTMTAMAADVAPGDVGILKFEITGPVQYEDLTSTNNKITIQNTGEPIREDTVYFDILMKGKQEPQTKVASISGYVRDRDTGDGIEGVRVLVKGLQISTYSQPDGYYSVVDIPTGNDMRYIDVEYTKVGYESHTETGVLIEVDKDTRISAIYLAYIGYPEPFPWMLVIGLIVLTVVISVVLYTLHKSRKPRRRL